jgi:hypothetical protein
MSEGDQFPRHFVHIDEAQLHREEKIFFKIGVNLLAA